MTDSLTNDTRLFDGHLNVYFHDVSKLIVE